MKDSEKKIQAQNPSNPNLMLAIRLIYLTKEKKSPIAGLPIVLAVEQAINNTHKILNIQAKLATNSNGYVSFKMSLEKFRRNPNIYVYPLGHEDLKVPMADFVKATQGDGIQTVEIDCKTAASIGKENIPSVQQADLLDHEFTPYFTHVQFNNSCSTFKDNIDDHNNNTVDPIDDDCDCHKHPALHDPNRYCAALIPGILPEECINTYQLNKNGIVLNNIRFNNNEPAVKIQEGIISLYESCFAPMGYSLGDLSYSTSLAPCESVNIAVENWFRKDKSVRSESTSLSETLENEVIRTKSVQEFIKSKLTEHKFNVGLSAAFMAGPVPVTANVGYAFGSKKSTTEMTQDINETHRQLSSAYSSYNSISIYETTQTESRNTTTRHIRNHNHCHTLTLMYFEIIQNIRIRTRHLGSRKGYFVQYPTPCFTIKDIIAKRHILREVLLDKQLVECLDGICLDEYTCDCSSGATTNDGAGGSGNNNSDCPATVTELHIKVRTADKTNAPSEGNLYLLVNLGGTVHRFFVPHAPDTKYRKNSLYEMTISIPPTCVTDVDGFGFELDGTDKIILASLEVDYTCQEDPANTYFLFNAGFEMHLRNEQEMIDVPVSPQLPDLKPTDTDVPPAVVDEQSAKNCCENNLLQHMNCNKLYYYKIFWMLEDENERAIRFANYIVGGTPFLDKIENNPVGVIGDWVAFIDADAPLEQGDQSVDETVIHAPTGNVFSEAILGQCGSCETIDDSVFWDWTGKTCPGSAPAITTGGLSQYQAAGLTPFNFANQLLSLQALSNLGATASLGAITEQALQQSVANLPSIPESAIESLLTILQESASSGSSDPDYQAAVQDLIDKLGDLKSIYELIDKIGGDE